MRTKKKIILAGTAIMMMILIPGISFAAVTFNTLNPVSAGLRMPEDVTISPDGKIYAVDGSNGKVQIYDGKGQPAGSISIQKPTSVAVNGSGNIYVGTNKTLSVEIFDASLTKIGSLGSGANEFRLPRNITIDRTSGNVYVVDQLDNSIKVYAPGGAFITKINDYPNLPQDVTILNNEIYVIDGPLMVDNWGGTIRGAEVQVFDMSGNPVRHFGSYGAQEGQFIRPAGITSDAAGVLYVTDSFHGVVMCFDSNGKYLGAIQNPLKPMVTPMGIALSGDKRLFAASVYTGSVHVFGLEGYTTMEVSPSELSYTAQQGQANPPEQTLTISNSGTGTLTYTATSTDSWIMLNASTGSIGPSGTETVSVGVNISTLGAGAYSANITVTDGAGASEVVRVNLMVSESPVVSFTVTPSAGANGSIDPPTPQTVISNGTASFTVTPNTGYQIASVTGCSGTLAGNIYTTGPITGDCTVMATFAINTYTITASAGPDGSITPSGAMSVNYGADQSFSITPSANCGVADVQVDGSSVGAVGSYTFSKVMADHTIVATFNKLDTTPPAGSITINSGATYTNTTSVTLNLSATDPSGVSQMCISDTQLCATWESYTSTKSWTLPAGDGEKTIYVWYQDNVGNADTVPYGASITLDTTVPVLNVSTLSDGSWTNNNLLNVAGEVTDDTGIQQLTVNGVVVTADTDGSFSYPVNLQEGPNTITVIATDLAGNQSAADTRTINLDQDAPIITIATPVDNMATNQTPLDVTGTMDDQSTITVTANGSAPIPAVMNGNNFSLPVTLVYGINTVEVTATDLAQNTSTAKRTVTFDDQNPSLSVTDPPQDVKTTQSTVIIKGVVSDLTPVAVTVTMDNDIYAPAVTSGQFEQPVTFTDEKTYQIYVKAQDEAGNETVVQRNVVYDTTAPVVTLDPVTSPTNLNSQVLTGTMEEGATVSVTCSTATVGAATYPASTVWSVTLTDMAEGNNQIMVTASDAEGNVSNNVTATIVVATNYITVTLPNGGESWARRTTQTIKWTYTGNPGSYVKIELLKGGVLNRTITTKTSVGKNGAGSYKWTVPSKQPTGSDYTIRITSTSNSNYTDTSNGNFTIK